jgi:hypothetical protein
MTQATINFGVYPLGIMPIDVFAKHARVAPQTIRRWNREGRINPFTSERIRCSLTALPSGGWGITERQYDEFIKALNERL